MLAWFTRPTWSRWLTQLSERGWTCCVILTPDAAKFTDQAVIEQLTGYPVRSVYKQRYEPDVHPPADSTLVAPADFQLAEPLV